VGAFSPDGQWWWDGANWVATSQIQLSLPMTEFERSGRLQAARRLVKTRELLTIVGVVGVAGIIGILFLPIFLVVYYVVMIRLFKAYREWTLELLTLATAQLLGPDEPMVAGETTAFPPYRLWPGVQRDFAVAVTRAHVLMYWFGEYDSPACRVVWAARPEEVEMRVLSGLLGLKRLAIGYAGRWWILRGIWRAFEPEQVMTAWSSNRHALSPHPASPSAPPTSPQGGEASSPVVTSQA
jgi:hypothetical protein